MKKDRGDNADGKSEGMLCPLCHGVVDMGKLTPRERIKHLRLDRGLSQSEIIKALGKSRGWLANIESKDGKLSMKPAQILAKYFKVSLDFIMYGK